MKHDTRELYNCSPLWFMFMPYILALYFKAYMADRNMKRLVELSWTVVDYSDELHQYIHVKRARDFNRGLIEEMGL